MQSKEPKPDLNTPFGSAKADDGMSAYDDVTVPAAEEDQASPPADAQDNYFEKREPSELIFCVILAAAYAGLARYLWEPLQSSGQWQHFISVEGFFITLSLLSLLLGVRPYISPSSLQISNIGLKYRGTYWPQRKSVNWSQIYRLYLSPKLIIVLYHPPNKPRGMRFLFIQGNYLSDSEQILARFSKYTPVPPVYLKNPDWYVELIFLVLYMSIICWILVMLRG